MDGAQRLQNDDNIEYGNYTKIVDQNHVTNWDEEQVRPLQNPYLNLYNEQFN